MSNNAMMGVGLLISFALFFLAIMSYVESKKMRAELEKANHSHDDKPCNCPSCTGNSTATPALSTSY